MFLLFQFCDTHLEVPLIRMNMNHLELTPESYNFLLRLLQKKIFWHIVHIYKITPRISRHLIAHQIHINKQENRQNTHSGEEWGLQN